MTRQDLIGEMSVLLAELQAATPRACPLAEVAQLRRVVETGSPGGLISVAGFNRHAATCVALHDFGVCAGLLDDG